MSQSQLSCDEPHCFRPAQAFGLRGTVKEKCCSTHLSLLVAKRMMLYDLDGYRFCAAAEDIPEFESRRTQVELGWCNLNTLSVACDSEFQAAEKLLQQKKNDIQQTVTRCFEAIGTHLQRKHQEAKECLESLGTLLDRYIESREAGLTESARLLCEEIQCVPKFIRLTVADASHLIAPVLLGNWKIAGEDPEVAIGLLDAANREKFIAELIASAKATQDSSQSTESLEYAQKLGFTGESASILKSAEQKRVDDLAAITEIFTSAFSDPSTDCKSLSDSQRLSLSAISQQCAEAEAAKLRTKELQGAWTLLEKHGFDDRAKAGVGLQLAELLYRFSGKFAEAEKIVKMSCEVEAKIAPLSEEAIKLSNAKLALYYHWGKYELAEECGSSILLTFEKVSLPVLHFWTTLLYFTESLGILRKKESAVAAAEEWRAKRLSDKSAETRVIRATVLARLAWRRGYLAEAEKAHNEAKNEASGNEQLAKSVYAAVNLHLLGNLMTESGHRDQAMELHRAAHSVYSASAPYSIHAANNLYNLGSLHEWSKQYEPAESHYLLALRVYEQTAPTSLPAACAYNNLGIVYKHLRKYQQSEQHFLFAHKNYEMVAPLSVDAACTMYNLGNLFATTERYEDAEEMYKQAQRVFDLTARQSLACANNMCNAGVLLLTMKRYEEAEKQLKMAQRIYKSTAPHSLQAAGNLFNMGLLYDAMGKLEEALPLFQSAQELYARNKEKAWEAKAEEAISSVHSTPSTATLDEVLVFPQLPIRNID